MVLASAEVQKQVTGLMGVGVGVEVLLLIATVAAGALLSLRSLVAIFYTFLNNILLAFGVLVVAVVIYLFATNGSTVAGMMDVVGYVLAIGLLFLASAVTGHCAVRRKSFPLNMAFIFLSLCVLGVTAGGSWLCFNRVDMVLLWLQTQKEYQLSKIASALGQNVDIASIGTSLAGNLRKLGLAFACIVLLQLFSVVNAAMFVWAVKSYRLEHGVRGGLLHPASRTHAAHTHATPSCVHTRITPAFPSPTLFVPPPAAVHERRETRGGGGHESAHHRAPFSPAPLTAQEPRSTPRPSRFTPQPLGSSTQGPQQGGGYRL